MPSDHHPQALLELRTCARHLVQFPLTCKEHDPEIFRLLRRHETELDRWFTQRLGYRLHVNADTARLFKDGFVPARRPLVTVSTRRPFTSLECTLLAMVLAATVAGPAVISLRDLVERVRSVAVEAGVAMEDSPGTRRALVTVLHWLLALGAAVELHDRVEAYAGNEAADAVLKFRPDRIALLPLPALAGAGSAEDLLVRAERRSATRQWMRCRLLEEPVLYRTDLSDPEWAELRRRLGEEERLFDEMFELGIEARAEGVAAVDPTGNLAGQPFPAGGTRSQAALLLIGELRVLAKESADWASILRMVRGLAEIHRRRWAADLVESPERLARLATELLVDLRLAEWVRESPAQAPASIEEPDPQMPRGERDDQRALRLLPAAARFLPAAGAAADAGPQPSSGQESLW